MSQKPVSLEGIWSERDLCARLDLPTTKSGRSRQLSNWVRGGLKFASKSGKRYFFDADVAEYIFSRIGKEDETE